MAEAPVLYSKHDSIVTLTLNRPATLNAMNVAMMAEFERLLLDIAAEVIHVEPDRCQGCRAGLEFRPSLPRRQYLLLRRLTRP